MSDDWKSVDPVVFEKVNMNLVRQFVDAWTEQQPTAPVGQETMTNERTSNER